MGHMGHTKIQIKQLMTVMDQLLDVDLQQQWLFIPARQKY